jgi:O-antigen ligase
LACIGALYAVRHARRKLSLVLGVLFLLLLIAAMLIAGQFLMQRLLPLLNSEDNSLVAHLIVWKAALRIIFGNPFMGIGLGAFQDAYNLYADTTLPFVIDKAHNDFLEFAAGVGLPAALLWWSSCLLIAGRCLFGAIRRHKNRIYPAAAAAAAILMAIHASVDFPLQIPAVSLMFSVIMGVGYAQAFSSRVRDGAMSRS